MEEGLLVIFKLFLQLFLFIIFLWFFGAESMAKFLDKKMIVVKSKEETGGIPSPAVTICGRHPAKDGRKNKTSFDSVLDACNSTDNVFKCADSQKGDFKDMVLDATKGSPVQESLMNETLWHRPFSVLSCHTFNAEIKIEPNRQIGRITFHLNRTVNYIFYIHSPELFVQNYMPLALPINRVKVFPSDCNSYLTLTLTKHHKVNTPSDPCEENPEYSFTDCVQESFARHVGCVLRQDKGNVLCTTSEHYRSVIN